MHTLIKSVDNWGIGNQRMLEVGVCIHTSIYWEGEVSHDGWTDLCWNKVMTKSWPGFCIFIWSALAQKFDLIGSKYWLFCSVCAIRGAGFDDLPEVLACACTWLQWFQSGSRIDCALCLSLSIPFGAVDCMLSSMLLVGWYVHSNSRMACLTMMWPHNVFEENPYQFCSALQCC